MTFKDVLNQYLKNLNCSSKNLSKESGLSQSVISRYRNGDRIPAVESDQFNKIINSIYSLFVNKGNTKIKKEDILNSFIKVIKKTEFDYENFSKRFDEIISLLGISIIEMSRFITFDSSYISRIRSGQRKPAYPDDFVDKVCDFIINKYNTKEYISLLVPLLKSDEKELLNSNIYFSKLRIWLTTNCVSNKDYIGDFLKNLDEFNLNDYIKTIKFDELKVPSIPFYRSKSKVYYGIKEMRNGELDFFKATVLSKSTSPIFMCSDMPMEDMAKDIEFGKKWMFAIATSLKKGLHLNIIHNLDRPFNEMMLGLESWIPIYMTGQVSPYYLKDNKDSIYFHLNYISGSVALSGECIKGYHNKGKYTLLNNKKEIEYYKTKSECLLKKANPLMDIYRVENIHSFNSFLSNYREIKANRKRVLSSLPIFTISEELLKSILKRNKISTEDSKKILEYRNNELKMINNILNNNTIFDEVNNISKEDLDNKKISLSLENIFYNKKIVYNHEEYNKHLKMTKNYSKKNSNYKFSINKYNEFHNIKITSVENKFVIISKSANPIIHFVINHPKLRNSIENFSSPIKE